MSAQVLVYPVTDYDITTASYAEFGGDDQFLTKKDMAWFFDHYVRTRRSANLPRFRRYGRRT